MNNDLEKTLIDCLDALERGESPATILNRYPEEADHLRPFLETALQLQTLNLQPSLAAQNHSRVTFLAEAEALRSQTPRRTRWSRALMPILGLAALFLLLSAALLPLSARAMPGHSFYSIKRLAETIHLAITTNADSKLTLIEQHKENRRQEILALLAGGQEADNLAFEGRIERLDADWWVIGGITTHILTETAVTGQPQVELLAVVNGRIRQERFEALTIIIPTGDKLNILPSPTPSPSPSALPDPLSTPVAPTPNNPTPASTVSPTVPSPTAPTTPATDPDNTPVATATATLAPPIPPPTETAVLPSPTPPPANHNDNDNDNGNDNDNDNDDDDNDDNDDDDNDDDDDDDNNNDD
jgi:hypothetical protein